LLDGHFVELRVPYPMGFFTKGLEGRIDDPGAGWKGRALWASSGNAPAPGAPGKLQKFYVIIPLTTVQPWLNARRECDLDCGSGF